MCVQWKELPFPLEMISLCNLSENHLKSKIVEMEKSGGDKSAFNQIKNQQIYIMGMGNFHNLLCEEIIFPLPKGMYWGEAENIDIPNE